jgi:hypothetical protein
MDEEEKERLMKHAERAMRRLSDRPIIIESDVLTIVSIIGPLQLAMRNDAYRLRPSWAITRRFTDALIEMLSEGDPEFREFLQM